MTFRRLTILRAAPLALAAAAAFSSGAAAQHGGRAADRAAVLLSDRPAPREGCRIEARPNPLPAVDAVVDSAALDARLRAYLPTQHMEHGSDMHVLVSLGWDGRGNPTRARPFDWFVPQGVGDELGAIVRATVRNQRGAANVRLRIDFAEGVPAYRLGRSEVCLPQGLERVNILAPAVAQIDAPHDVRVRVTVGAQGQMMGSQLVGSSGQRYWDDEVMRMVSSARFAPGIVDEAPETMDYEATIHFRSR